MKKIFNYITLFAALSATLLTGCKKEEVVFDHEKPQFEVKDDAITLEVIMPTGTAADEQLFITGEFNGGEKYQLSKAEGSDKKWGILLYAIDFAEGKSLTDGFTFVSATNGKAYSAMGEPQTWNVDAKYGTSTNIWVSSWEAFFKNGEEKIEHDGHVAYVIDETGWDVLTMYAWGDAEAFGGWPGMEPTGKEKVNGVEYIYFDLGEANEGLNLNLIFNNGGNGVQLGDFNFTVDRDVFLKLTADGAEEITPSDGDVWPTIKHDGQDIVFVADMADWGAMALYMWGDVNNLDREGGEGAGWPGLEPDGHFEFQGVTWYYFLMGATNEGKNENMIFNNNGGGEQTSDANITFAAGGVYYYVATGNKEAAEVVEDPTTVSKEPLPDPEPEPGRIDTVLLTVKDTITTHLYFVKETESMNNIYVYHADKPAFFGAWPGVNWTEWETANFLGQVFYHYEFKAEYGTDYSFIINNNADKQYNAFGINVGAKTDYFFSIQDEKVVEMGPSTEQAGAIRRMFRK